MNILCQTWPDARSIGQLRRFIYYGRRNCTAVYHVLHIGEKPEPDALEVFKQFDKVHVVKSTPFIASLLGSDFVRTQLLRVFGLTEGLYLDTDIDILGDLNTILRLSDAQILCTLDPVYGHDRRYDEMLKLYNLDPNPPYMCNGFLYLRIVDGLDKLFMDIWRKLQVANLSNAFIPGCGIWNVITRMHSHHILDKKWHVLPLWDTGNIKGAKCLHWCGTIGKSVRRYISYYDGVPIINPEVQPCSI